MEGADAFGVADTIVWCEAGGPGIVVISFRAAEVGVKASPEMNTAGFGDAVEVAGYEGDAEEGARGEI